MFRLIRSAAIILLFALHSIVATAQQTLGAINGNVTDSTGAVLGKVSVKVKSAATNLEISATTRDDGSYQISALPIGKYALTFSLDGFNSEVHSEILVQGGLTTTVNGALRAGSVSTSITVTGTPLLNQTDTTIGYTLGSELIENTPLGTGSFTQLALLSPGVNADFLTGSGSNAGLGNQNIFANGQRDTSNSFIVNGVQTNNLFNGKSSSGVADNRSVLNTGENFSSVGGEIQTSTSVYSAIGQSLPSPPQETLEEVRVNTAMYDASEGSYSGAHITMQTKSGSNSLHGQAYEYHQTDGWNATPFFFNADPALHDPNGPTHGNPRPYLKRNTFGATVGGPILKDKLFFFASYQGQRAVDEDSSISEANVIPGLADNNRDAASLAGLVNTTFNAQCGTSANPNPCLSASDINSVALTIMNLKLPNGQYFIPSETAPGSALGYNALAIGPRTTFKADQVNGNIDYNFNARDRLAAKYYFQHDPTYAPFVISQVGNFPQQLSAGSQLFSLENTTTVSPNAVWTQKFGFVRETAYAHTIDGYSNSDYGISIFGLSNVPGINIGNANTDTGKGLAIGPSNNFSNAGVFQNTFEGSTKYSWTVGRHTLAFGAQWDKTQLNVINKNNKTSLVNFNDFQGFLEGDLCNPQTSCGSAGSSVFVNGETNRYFRSNQVGLYSQDTWRVKQNLTVTLGLRWDWNGPLVEKYGRLTNFYPKSYSFDSSSDAFSNIGIVVAGNNKDFPTKGVSDSTLTGRQWGFAPRIGIAWTPGFVKNLVVRAGYGLYYDRGEYFAELSPSAGGGIGGPFGVTVEQPFSQPYYSQPGATFATPFGTSTPPAPPKDLSGVTSLIPNISDLINNTTPYCTANGISFCGPLQFAGYDPSNKLPYSENWLLDLQWQPRNDLVFTLSYVGNHGQHEVIPVPFNQPGIATPSSPINGQIYSYGYNVPGVSAENVSTLVEGYGAGNVDLRVPFIGYDPNSQYARAAGISNYDALQFNVTKRTSHGLTVTGSYTWSHAMDEESGEQLFYNGDNPQNLRTGYGNSDFDRRHVFAISYMYSLPTVKNLHGFLRHVVNGWGTSGVISAESGQPYSVIDFTGGIASLYYGGGEDFITNPLVPIGGIGSTSTHAVLQGTLGVDPSKPVLNPAAFGIPLLQPGNTTYGTPPCDSVTGACDVYETAFGAASRNIFVGPFQSRVDMSVFKNFKISERFQLKFDVQAFNIFNHPSFDTPNNNVQFNPYYANPPQYGSPNCGAPDAYVCPPAGQLGLIQHTIGSPRFLQMALHLTF